MSETARPPYYSDERLVFKRPIERDNGDGTKSVTMGFLVCEVAEFVDPADVAELLNAGEQFDALVAALEKATYELNAIRARDGAPQHIVWYRGQPTQHDACTKEWWDELTEMCFAALAQAKE